MMNVYGLTQHAALAENVLDHRLNCRTIYMNPVHRFLYWNMNYHMEHHMFPLVPYHQLPRLHQIVKGDCPEPYPSPDSGVSRNHPGAAAADPPARLVRPPEAAAGRATRGHQADGGRGRATGQPTADGWIDVCASDALKTEDVAARRPQPPHVRDLPHRAGAVHATDGMRTHGNTHLADGMVSGAIVERPKHNGRFDVVSGEPRAAPRLRRAAHARGEGGGRAPVAARLARPRAAGVRARVHAAGREQPERRDVHQGTGSLPSKAQG